MSRSRILFLSLTLAAVVFVVGATGIGQAAERLVLPANSVGTSQLKNGAVTGAKVRAHSLTAVSFKKGTLRTGPVGPAGPTGPAGPAGAPGTAASLGLQFVTGESGFDNSSAKSATASCPAGKRAISWAARIQLVSGNNPATAPGLTSITPNNFDPAAGTLPDSYTVSAATGGSYPDSWKLFAYATCANS